MDDKIEEEYINIQANFALKLLRQIQKAELKSSILSPISLSICLAIMYNGAAGETAKQIADIIADGKSQESINAYFSKVFKQLQSDKDAKYTLKSANRLYAAEKFKILQNFTDIAEKDYGGQFDVVDFENNLEGARKKINDFIESATNNLIKDMIAKGVLRTDTRLIVVNAMYFLGKWKTYFSLRSPSTKPQDFYVSESITKKVYMMKSYTDNKRYRYEKTAEYEILGLEYQGNYAMFILLPKERFGLSKLIEKLDGSILTKHAKNTELVACKVTMPRFSFNLAVDLKTELQNIGIYGAFNENNANFSKLTDAERVYVYAALHQSLIKVNEEGTEMASGSAMPSAPCSGGPTIPPKLKFVADHPFLYFVADNFGNILFIGTVVDNFQDESQKKAVSRPSHSRGLPAAKRRRIK